ncbi:MAG: DUF1828 domain-containing protein [Deltaproteobacteria bacterium]|nr:DUF1828 domain-containing protein [Deltaproteobacteria bacterium]
MDPKELEKRLAGHSLVHQIDMVERGYARIQTAFLYPEGSSIDVFLAHDAPLFDGYRLSDMGQTFDWLLDVQVRPWLSRKRQSFVGDVLRIYGVSQNGGALELPLASLDELPQGIVRLGQACVRVADLIYTRRSSLQAPIAEEVEELIADTELLYETNPELEGRYGNRVRVDFLVHGPHTPSAILTWSSASGPQAHIQGNEIFRRWYDLDTPDRREQRVTVWDDRYDSYRSDDLDRVRDMSDLVALSERTTIRDLLAA